MKLIVPYLPRILKEDEEGGDEDFDDDEDSDDDDDWDEEDTEEYGNAG